MTGEIYKCTVLHNGETVGYLALLNDGFVAFQYDGKWLQNGFALSPFSLPLTSDVYVCRKNTFGGLYGVFADSLPDGWGELLVKRMLASNGINYDRLNPLTKLSLVSSNGLGGLQYLPTQAQPTRELHCNLDELSQQANAILNEDHGVSELDDLYRFGGSSGGARPKAHVDLDGEPWIVKFPCRIDPPDAGVAEFKANSLAERCGVRVNEYALFPSAICSGFFGAKRFDRQGECRLHVLSLSALLETSHRVPNLDYVHLLQSVAQICIDADDVYEAYRRACFNVIFANRDDHGKNFSFVYDPASGGYRLSPAYDTTLLPHKPEHEMTVLGNGKPSVADLRRLAEYVGLRKSRCEQILNEVALGN